MPPVGGRARGNVAWCGGAGPSQGGTRRYAHPRSPEHHVAAVNCDARPQRVVPCKEGKLATAFRRCREAVHGASDGQQAASPARLPALPAGTNTATPLPGPAALAAALMARWKAGPSSAGARGKGRGRACQHAHPGVRLPLPAEVGGTSGGADAPAKQPASPPCKPHTNVCFRAGGPTCRSRPACGPAPPHPHRTNPCFHLRT